MRPLETNKSILKWLSISPSVETADKWHRIAYFMLSISIFVAHFLAVTAGGLRISKFVSINLEEAILSLYNTIASFTTLYQSIVIIFLRHKFDAIFNTLSNIYDESKKRIFKIIRYMH